ncbi:Hypothetical predicted protein [Lecanosticta acicola]|uniref:Uncharacterized protein n=1 Tax=Lecanosticta acicola TaxID=111012 RepID=A0AAI8Z8U1_9PEZI|nr:Hypothetical predicted protein [Lecanosticta acicola]
MPKGLNLKGFGRRKSSGNALEFDEPEAAVVPPGQSSFRVIERPEKRTQSTYGSQANVKFNSPLHALRGKSVDDLGLAQNRSVTDRSKSNQPGWLLNGARGSGGTTNSGSSGHYDSSSASARYSSTSTLPSSVEQDRDDELFAPVRKSQTQTPHATGMYHSVAANADSPPLPQPPSFTSRAARALSFGNNRSSKASSRDAPPMPPPHAATNGAPLYPQRSQSPYRERAMTTSSYASTAVPTKTELRLSVDAFGTDDFGSMFDSLKKDSPPAPAHPAGSFHHAESEPMFPPRTYSRPAPSSSPNALILAQSRRENNESPYYSDGRDSNEGLVSNRNSALSSPSADGNAPGPAVANGITQAFLGSSKSGYSRVPEHYTSPGLERASIESYRSVMDNETKAKEPERPSRQTQVDDEDRLVRRIELHDPPGSSSPGSVKAKPVTAQRQQLHASHATAGASRADSVSPHSTEAESAIYAESNNTTPRAARSKLKTMPENSILNSSPVGPPSAAIRPGAHQRTDSGGMKMMTKAQFQALRQRGESSEEQSEEEDLSGDEYDDEDDVERAKKMATQRRKQEANMSLYRQQMKKVTGGGPTDLPSSAASTVRPSMDRGATAPAATGGGGIHFGGIGGTPPSDTVRGKPGDDEDDDVPLGILQAHGFPTSSRPPTRVGENDISQQRRTSVAGSVVGGGAGQGNLPPFARRLPADPYFGAGLVNPSTRESLAMNSTSGSVVGMPTGQMTPQPAPSMGHPGGLVGVIAGEERARAARRGSPNMALGTYNNPMGGPMPLPQNMPMQPPMPRTMSMGNLAPPSMYGAVPPMPPMPQMQQPPIDPGQQQMQQFMQMQMQLMQNMLQMQQQQMGQARPQTPMQQPTQQAHDYLGVNFGNNAPRRMSMASNHSNYLGPPTPNQGRAMTMMNPPPSWNQAAPAGGPRPNSAMPMGSTSYAPSVSGLPVAGGAGPGYTPSIAPSERSNIGMPSRYRPVTQNGETSRSQSMTSSMTLQAFANQQSSANVAGTPYNGQQIQTPKSTIRIVDKPKGAPKTAAPRAGAEDEDDGWAEMRKEREQKKRFKRGKKSSTSTANNGPSLNDLYQGLG